MPFSVLDHRERRTAILGESSIYLHWRGGRSTSYSQPCWTLHALCYMYFRWLYVFTFLKEGFRILFKKNFSSLLSQCHRWCFLWNRNAHGSVRVNWLMITVLSVPPLSTQKPQRYILIEKLCWYLRIIKERLRCFVALELYCSIIIF